MMVSELTYFAQQLLNGLSVGSMYALIAVGYSLVYSSLRLVNFAHGDLYVLGTFVALASWKMGLPIPLAIICGCVGGAVLGLGVERIAYRPLRTAHPIMSLISGLGAAMILRTTSQLIWGPQTLSFFQIGSRKMFTISDFRIMSQQIQVLGTAALCMILLTVILRKTKFGKATQCVMQDIELSRMVGIPVDSIIPWFYAVGGLLGVVGGVLWASYYSAVTITMGILGTIKAWAGAALGGMGSLHGAFIGGLLLGVGEALAGAYLSPGFKDGFGYMIIIMVLLWRPYGLFGKKRVEKV